MKMGSQHPAILPSVEREVRPITTPMQTIQLQSSRFQDGEPKSVRPKLFVAERLGLGGGDDQRRGAGRGDMMELRLHGGIHPRVKAAASQIPCKDPRQISQDAEHANFAGQPRRRDHGKTTRDQFQSENHYHGKTNWEQNGANDRRQALSIRRESNGCSESKQCTGKNPAQQQLACRQPRFCCAISDKSLGNLRRVDVIHNGSSHPDVGV